MKKQFLIIITILLILAIIAGMYVIQIRIKQTTSNQNNKFYEQYKDVEISGRTLISIMHKAIDSNEQNEVDKLQDNIHYEENSKNSIKITVKFSEMENTISMEDIVAKGSENFVKFFATANFKCTDTQYHSETNFIKSMHFEQI